MLGERAERWWVTEAMVRSLRSFALATAALAAFCAPAAAFEGACPANQVMAGPASGPKAPPLCRPLVPADIPGPNSPTYFAKCNGTSTDDTPIVQAAADTAGQAGGGIVALPALCTVAGTIHLNKAGVRLVGTGIGSTTINCTGTGSADCIQIGSFPALTNCVGATPPANCSQIYYTGIDHALIYAPTRTGGYCINIFGASQTYIHDFNFNCWALTKIEYANTTKFQDANGYENISSGGGIYYKQDITSASLAWFRSDYLDFTNVTVNGQNKGGQCFVWDGPAYDVVAYHPALLGCNGGVTITNAAASTSLYSAFGFFYDLEVDGGTGSAVSIQAGTDFKFVNSDLDSIFATNGTTIFAVLPDTGNSYTRGITVAGSAIHDGPNGGLYLNGKDIIIANTQCFDTNHNATGVNPCVEIGANADVVSISGSLLGQRFGDPDAPSVGVLADSGSAGISLSSNIYKGAVTGNFTNNSGATQSFLGGIGYNGSPITVTTCANSTTC